MRVRSLFVPILGLAIGLVSLGSALLTVGGVWEEDRRFVIRPWLFSLHLGAALAIALGTVAIAVVSFRRKSGVYLGGWSVLSILGLGVAALSLLTIQQAYQMDYWMSAVNLPMYALLLLVLAWKTANARFRLIWKDGWQEPTPTGKEAYFRMRMNLAVLSLLVATSAFLLMSWLWIEPGHLPNRQEDTGFLTKAAQTLSFTAILLVAVALMWLFHIFPYPTAGRKGVLAIQLVLTALGLLTAAGGALLLLDAALVLPLLVFAVQAIMLLYLAGPVAGFAVRFLPRQQRSAGHR